MTKADLVERATKWGAKRNVKFRISLLNEWIDRGLVDEGDRLKNVGKRPVFRYRCRHYRRVLQVLRLYALGIKQTDEILIMLFINGHGVKPHQVREPLAREFARGRAKINAQARSVRFDQDGAIPPKHMESLIRSIGQADKRFLAAKVVLPGAQMIEIMRAARHQDPESAQRNPKSASAEPAPVAVLRSLMGGLMAGGDDDGVGEGERMLRNASNSELDVARSALMSIRQIFASASITSAKVNVGPLREAYLASFAQPEFVTAQLVNMIRLSALKEKLPFNDLLRFYEIATE